MEELDAVVGDLPMREGELGDAMVRDLFPLLDMDGWIDHILDHLPPGLFTTFGAVAKALGTPRAARAVGERIASGELKGPIQRVVYSDGKVPTVRFPGSTNGSRPQDGPGRIETDRLVRFDIPLPPFSVLSGLQSNMAGLLTEERPEKIGLVAGTDISSAGEVHSAGMVVMDLEGEGRGELCVRGPPGLPYVSGFLFYREAPLLLPLISLAMDEGLIDEGSLIAMDGNGVLHPRRMGIACQIGAATGARTCGIAKRLLLGKVSSESRFFDGKILSDVTDGGEVLGSALSTKGSSKPVYVSRGNRIDLGTVEKIISGLTRSRVPEPTRRAHLLANACRRSEAPSRDL